MNNIKFISPFKRLCVTVGSLPSSYVESMSYYECLTYFMNFLEKEVIPTINNNAEVVKELQDFVTNYFDNLDVQEEINNKLDDMAESGALADIIAQYLQLAGVLAYDTLSDLKQSKNIIDGSICKTLGKINYDDGEGNFYKIRNITSSDVVDEDNIVSLNISNTLIAQKIKNKEIENNSKNIIELKNKLNINSIKESLYSCPLLVIKKLINGTSGDSGSIQGMTASYIDNEVDKIYIWCDYNDYARLYIVTCGSRIDGSNWSYDTITSLPNVHGSCLSLKDNFLLVGDVENGNGKFLKINLSDFSYTYETIDDINSYILGVVWDEETKTYLVCCDENKKMYILDENYNIINHYEHDVEWITNETNYTMQGYDYKNGYEIRTISTNLQGNMIVFIDTENGKLLKTCSLDYINGEIESINYNNGYALISVNSLNQGSDLINMNSVLECYIGGINDNKEFNYLQNKKMMGHSTAVGYGLKGYQYGNVLYYQNNHDNDEIIRYCGTGTQINPISSGLALAVYLCSSSWLYSQYRPTINILSSSNSDDNGLIIVGKQNIDKLYIVGNNNNINYLELEQLSFDIININVTGGVSRRNNGCMSLYSGYSNCRLRGTNTCRELLMENNSIIGVFDTGITSSERSFIRRNVIVGFSKITGNPLQDYENIKMV